MGGPSVSKSGETVRGGKEESYERNPGRVPFVLNPKFSELLKGLKTCPDWRTHGFASLGPPGWAVLLGAKKADRHAGPPQKPVYCAFFSFSISREFRRTTASNTSRRDSISSRSSYVTIFSSIRSIFSAKAWNLGSKYASIKASVWL